MPRFSKAALLEDLNRRYNHIQKRHEFNPNYGWSQVEDSDTETKVAYGRFSMLQDLMEDLES